MLKSRFQDLYKKFCDYVSGIDWKNRLRTLTAKPLEKILGFLRSWWQVLIVAFGLLIFLYYPLGSLIINNLDRTTEYEISRAKPEQSATVDMAAFLIQREIGDKMWTPNLPFFFPSYFLDNMPNYQLGIMSSVSAMTGAMAKRLDKTIAREDDLYLKSAAELLRYPGTIWMFSPQNPLKPVPSANTQYRRARKQLIKYNQTLAAGEEVFYRRPADLAFFLKAAGRNLGIGVKKLETHIREESNSLYDGKADDVFYYNRGKTYASYLLLKALGQDYEKVIVDAGLYNNWTKLLKALETGSQLDPWLVRNAGLDSACAANHLVYLSFYMIKAQKLLEHMATTLNTVPLTSVTAKAPQ